jgi:hypothetical protein
MKRISIIVNENESKNAINSITVSKQSTITNDQLINNTFKDEMRVLVDFVENWG